MDPAWNIEYSLRGNKHEVWKYFIKTEKHGVCKLCKKHFLKNSFSRMKTHIKIIHEMKSDVIQYYKDVNKNYAVCLLCNFRIMKTRKGNLIRHIERVHKIEIRHLPFIEQLNTSIFASTNKDEENSSSDSVDAEYSTESEEDFKHFLEYNKKSQFKSRKFPEPFVKPFKIAVCGLMLEDGFSAAIFDSKHMRKLINPICHAVSIKERKKCKIDQEVGERILCSVAKQLHEDFSNELHWRLLSLKIDMDFEGPHKTFCLSCSFIQNGLIVKRILGLIDLVDDNQITEQHIKQVLYKYNIDFSQIIYICWDNTKAKYNTVVTNSNYLNEIDNFERHPITHLDDLKIERYVGVFAQLCLLDVFKNSDIFQPFLNCRNFIQFINNKSNGYCDIFMKNDISMPQLDSPWKWGTTYKMMQDLQKAYNVLQNETFPKQELLADQFNVDNDFWLFVNGFCESLNSIQKSITKFYTEEIHFGDFYALWLKSKLLTEKLTTNKNISNKFVTLITSELLKCFKKRTNDIFSNDAFHACLYMDPRFQHILKPEDKSKAVIYLKNIWNRCKIYKPEVRNAAKDTPTEASFQSPEVKDEEESLLTNYLVGVAKEDLYSKIEQLHLPHKPADTNILLFWENQKLSDPEMCYLSEICFSIPSTQNYKQKQFAHIHKMLTDQKMSSVTREERVIACLNSHLVQNVSEYFDMHT